MDRLQFTASIVNSVASIIGALAWPVVIGVLLYLMRDKLEGLATGIRELTLPGGFKATFEQSLEAGRIKSEEVVSGNPEIAAPAMRLNDRELELSKSFPEAAVLQAYIEIERIIGQIRSFTEALPVSQPLSVAAQLVNRGLIDSNTYDLFRSLRRARNAAAHGSTRDGVSSEEAIEFVNQARLLREILEKVLEKLRLDRPQPEQGQLPIS